MGNRRSDLFARIRAGELHVEQLKADGRPHDRSEDLLWHLRMRHALIIWQREGRPRVALAPGETAVELDRMIEALGRDSGYRRWLLHMQAVWRWVRERMDDLG